MHQQSDILRAGDLLKSLNEHTGQLVRVRGRLQATRDDVRLVDLLSEHFISLNVDMRDLDKADPLGWALVGGPLGYDYEAVVTGRLDLTGRPTISNINLISLTNDDGEVNELVMEP